MFLVKSVQGVENAAASKVSFLNVLIISVCIKTLAVFTILSTLAEAPVPPVPSLTNVIESPTAYPSPESIISIADKDASATEATLALAPTPPPPVICTSSPIV